MSRYATGTGVAVDRSKAELEKVLSKYGASKRLLGADDDKGEAYVIFEIEGRQVRLQIPLPKLRDFAFKYDGRAKRDKEQEPEVQMRDHEQACRERWRVFVLLVKAKLEAVELGLSTIEREFLADIYLPSGQTVGQVMKAALAKAYKTGKMPALPSFTERRDDE